MKIILIFAKSFASGIIPDYTILVELLSSHYECIKIEGKVKYNGKPAYAKICLEHLLPQWLAIPSEKTYFIPNHEMLTEWDMELAKKVDMILCKNELTYELMSQFNRRLIKFTSQCCHSTAKKDFDLFIHFGGTSFMKGTLELIKFWIECDGFVSANKNAKLLITHSPKFNNNVVRFWKSLKPVKRKTFMGRKLDCENYKNIYFVNRLSNDDYNYFSVKAGIRVQPSILEGYGHTVNEGRCNGTLTITTDARPMNELITDKRCLISSGHNIPSYEVFRPFHNLYKYMYRGSSRAHFIDKLDFKNKIESIIALSEDEKISIAANQRSQYNSDTEFFSSEICSLFGIASDKWDKKVFSQNGEDGIIEHIFNSIGTTNKYYVEFGVEDGTECNTRYLRENKNWSGLMMDGGHENQKINLQKEFINASNICELFKKYSVPKEFDFLSVDIDYNDFYVLNEILKCGFRPRVICSEYNSYLGDKDDKVVIYDPDMMWDRTKYFGASITAFANLFSHHGYSIVMGTSIGVNIFAIDDNIKHKFKKIGVSAHRKLNDKYHKDDYHDRKFLSSSDAINNLLYDRVKQLSRKVDVVFNSGIVKQLRGKYTGIIVKKDWKESKKIENAVMDVVRHVNLQSDDDKIILETLAYNKFNKLV